MPITVEPILRRTSALVNQRPGKETRSDAQLLPYIRLAYEDIARRLRSAGFSIFRKDSPLIYVPPTTDTTTITPTEIPRTLTYVGDIQLTGSGLNDLTFSGTYTGTEPARFQIEITTAAAPDVFKWRKNGAAYTTGVNVTGGAQVLSDGISVTFAATTGHTLGNVWGYYCMFYPSDLLRPLEVREKVASSATATLQRVARSDGIMPEQSTATLHKIWDWWDDTIMLLPASGETIVQFQYEAELSDITMPDSSIVIPESMSPIAYMAAYLVLQADLDFAVANEFKKVAEEQIAMIANNETNARMAIKGRWGAA